MKWIFLLLPFLLTGATIFAQTFRRFDLKNDPQYYKGTLLKVTDTNTYQYYHRFYNSINIKNDDSVAFCIDTGQSDKSKLLGQLFKVIGVFDETGNALTHPLINDQYGVLKLKNTVTGDTLYFKYDPIMYYKFPFVVSGGKYPDNFFYDRILNLNDKFTNEVSYNTGFVVPGDDLEMLPLTLFKNKRKDGSYNYQLLLDTDGSTADVNGIGIIILFQDGSKITRSSSKIDIKVNTSTQTDPYNYSGSIDNLSIKELRMLATKPIDAFRLYIFDRDLTEKQSDYFQNMVNTLLKYPGK